MSPGLSTYHIPSAMRLVGSLDVPRLRSALDALVSRHESLRTTFELADGRADPGRSANPVRCSSGRSICRVALRTSAERTRRISTRRSGAPSIWRSDLMLRGVVVRLGAREHVLRLVAHHIAADGWSIGILFREFAELYRAFTAGEGSIACPVAHPVCRLRTVATAAVTGRGTSESKWRSGGGISKESPTPGAYPPTGLGRRSRPTKARCTPSSCRYA